MWLIYPLIHSLSIFFECSGILHTLSQLSNLWSHKWQCSIDQIICYTLDVCIQRCAVHFPFLSIYKLWTDHTHYDQIWSTHVSNSSVYSWSWLQYSYSHIHRAWVKNRFYRITPNQIPNRLNRRYLVHDCSLHRCVPRDCFSEPVVLPSATLRMTWAALEDIVNVTYLDVTCRQGIMILGSGLLNQMSLMMICLPIIIHLTRNWHLLLLSSSLGSLTLRSNICIALYNVPRSPIRGDIFASQVIVVQWTSHANCVPGLNESATCVNTVQDSVPDILLSSETKCSSKLSV